DPLHRTRYEPRLPVEKEERDHADEGRQHRRERDQRAEGFSAGEVEPLEEERERHTDRRRQHDARKRDPHARPQGRPFAGVGDERPERVAARRIRDGDENGIQHEPREEQGEAEPWQDAAHVAMRHQPVIRRCSIRRAEPRIHACPSRNARTRNASTYTRSPTRAAPGSATTSRRSRLSTPTRSPKSKASSCSWVTNTVVMPTRLITARSSRRVRSRRLGSRLESGSSSSSTRGSGASARASATRCCCPPESSWGLRRSKPVRSTSSKAPATLRSRPCRSIWAKPKATFSPTSRGGNRA